MNMAEAILGEQEKKEYDACLSYIIDAYCRMSTNRDTDYRVQQLKVAEKKLEKMTELLEGAAK